MPRASSSRAWRSAGSGASTASSGLRFGLPAWYQLFTWPAVLEDRNVHGPLSIAVPGHVDGMGLALERFGTKSWMEVLSPAIQIADQGMAVDWYLTLKIATVARELTRYPSTRAVWMRDGFPPTTPAGAPLERPPADVRDADRGRYRHLPRAGRTLHPGQ